MNIESLQIQISCEEQDLKDKNKMSLVGAKESKLTKQDMHASKIERTSKEKLADFASLDNLDAKTTQ